ncbi:MAG: ABC transporter permease [Gemmatimonadota bacterium]
MLTYLVRRLALAFVTTAAVVVITFALVHLAPGQPFLTGAEGRFVPPEAVAHLRERFGLDRPLAAQFVRYVANLAQGDLGESFARRRPVAAVLRDALPNTLLLGGAALVLSFAFGLGLGIVQALRAGTLADAALSTLALAFYSVPAFWLGLMLLLVFGEWLHWLPVAGMTDAAMHGSLPFAGRALDVARHLVLPALTLALVNGAAVARFHRSAMVEALGAEFVRAARARGLGERRVVLRHALRSALAPAITLAGLSVPALLTGSVLVESVFGWPGMGRVAFEAIFARDYNIITAIAVVAGVLVALGNLLADLGVAAADPRVRRG